MKFVIILLWDFLIKLTASPNSYQKTYDIENLTKFKSIGNEIRNNFTFGFPYKIDRISKILAENARSRKISKNSKLSKMKGMTILLSDFLIKLIASPDF